MAKKRGNHEGTISQRKDGRWEARVTVGYIGGKLKRKCLYGKTRKEVQEKMTEVLRSVQKGLPVVNDKILLGAFLDDWLESVVKPNKRPKTYASYAQIVKNHIKPELGNRALTRLTAKDVQQFLNSKAQSKRMSSAKDEKVAALAKPISLRSVQYMREVLRNALNQAVKWDMVPRNVAELATGPQVKRNEVTSLTPEQAAKLIEAAKGHRFEAMFSVVLAIGLRLGEACGQRWNDIDMEKGELRVNNQLQRVGNEWLLTAPKTRSGARTVVLPKFAIEALRAHRIKQTTVDRVAAGDKWQETGFVFTTPVGLPLDDSVVRKELRNLLKKAELPPMRFHDLRHTCASLLLAQKVPPRVVMEILGHSQISLTMNTYSHVIPSLEREAADLMDGILTQKSAIS